MAAPRYTRQQLFTLRNHIPIDMVIEALTIPSSTQTGQYRFRCPVCNEMNTGINPKTNLARCFNCERNYNTIDLVIAVMDITFIKSVAYLEKLKASMPIPIIQTSLPQQTDRHNDMVHIGDVFKSLIPAKPGKPTCVQPPKYENPIITDLQKRVSDLEKQIKLLTQKILLIERQ